MNKDTMSTMMSSAVQNYSTPQWLFDRMNELYNFTFDLAADKSNHKCKSYYTEKDDSLSKKWHETDGWQWLNPPYGRSLYFWIKKAYNEVQLGARIVLLIPARTDTRYFHEFIFNNPYLSKIIWIKGRLKFSGNKNSAPFPSCIIVLDGLTEGVYINTHETINTVNKF